MVNNTQQEPIAIDMEALVASLNYASTEHPVTQKAFSVLRQLTDWFDRYDPKCTSKPNVRVSSSLLGVCIGEECVWNSQEHNEEQLNLNWILCEYRKQLVELLSLVDKWQQDETITYTGEMQG